MKRGVLVALAVAAMVSLMAAPALAKGPDVRVSTRAVITGPGLRGPIEVKGDVSAYGFDGSEAPHNELTDELLLYSGLSDQDVGWYELPPDPATLGPGYEITYTFMGKGSDQTVEVPLFGAGAKIDLTVPFTQTLYPYAPERPLVYTAPGQFFLSRMMGQWWSAPPALRAWLVSKGLPVAPVVVPAPAKPPSTPKVPAGAGYSWAVAFAITGLLAMVVTAAVAGRRAQVRRNRLSA